MARKKEQPEVGRTPMIGGLQIGHDPVYQRRMWIVQRVGWGGIVAICIAAMLGLLGGDGPLSRERLSFRPGLAVTYPRLDRHGSQSTLEVQLGAGSARSDSTAVLWLDARYATGLGIRRITPQPERAALQGDVVLYTFRIADPARATTIRFDTNPEGTWRQHARLGLVGGASYAFTHFLFP